MRQRTGPNDEPQYGQRNIQVSPGSSAEVISITSVDPLYCTLCDNSGFRIVSRHGKDELIPCGHEGIGEATK